MNKFYGLGIGPGEPELITLKAFRILQSADLIFTPKARIKSASLAREIVENVLECKKEFVEIEFPMTKNSVELNRRYFNAAELILGKIDEGNKIAYLTIGDPLLYSTYIYLINALQSIAPEVKIETVPGISAYSAVASRFNYSLAEKNERITICPVPKEMAELREILSNNDTVVIMKVAKRLSKVINLLREMNLLDHTVFGSHVGLAGEKMINGREEPFNLSEKEGYLSTIIVRSGMI